MRLDTPKFEVGQTACADNRCGLIQAVEDVEGRTSVSISFAGGNPIKMWADSLTPSPAIVISRDPTDAELLKAIEIRGHESFRAMNIANSLGGRETPEWFLCRNFGLCELQAEAKRRGI